jgi:hypothetical protein
MGRSAEQGNNRLVRKSMTYALSLLLMGLAGVLLDMHRRSWRAMEQNAAISPRDRRFARSQYRRRRQASAIIGVLGAAIGIWPVVPMRPWPIVVYVAALGGSCIAIMLLAAIDAWASRQNYVRLQTEQFAAQIRLAREVGETKAKRV